jgi:hypothetical protein
VTKRNKSVLGAATLVAGAILHSLGGRNSQGAQADGVATTNSTAAAAREPPWVAQTIQF